MYLPYHDCRDPTSYVYKHDFYCVSYNVTCWDEEYLNYGETGKKIYDAVKIERRYEKRNHDVNRKANRYEWMLD